jgi:hypothetical protein
MLVNVNTVFAIYGSYFIVHELIILLHTYSKFQAIV